MDCVQEQSKSLIGELCSQTKSVNLFLLFFSLCVCLSVSCRLLVDHHHHSHETHWRLSSSTFISLVHFVSIFQRSPPHMWIHSLPCLRRGRRINEWAVLRSRLRCCSTHSTPGWAMGWGLFLVGRECNLFVRSFIKFTLPHPVDLHDPLKKNGEPLYLLYVGSTSSSCKWGCFQMGIEWIIRRDSTINSQDTFTGELLYWNIHSMNFNYTHGSHSPLFSPLQSNLTCNFSCHEIWGGRDDHEVTSLWPVGGNECHRTECVLLGWDTHPRIFTIHSTHSSWSLGAVRPELKNWCAGILVNHQGVCLYAHHYVAPHTRAQR